MKFSVEVTLDEIYAAMEWVAPIIGGALDKRVRGWKTEAKSNPFLLQHYEDYYPIEFRLAYAREQKRLKGNLPKGDDFNVAYTFVVALHRLFEQLPTAGHARLKGRLRGSLKDRFGFRPIAYEVSTCVHLAAKDYEFEWLDGGDENRFDLLAKKNGCEVEIECKSTSVDTGRKVHHIALCRVAGAVLDEIDRLSQGGTHLFDITVPERLDRGDAQIEGVSSLLAQSIRDLTDVKSDFGVVRHFSLKDFDDIFDETPVRSRFDLLTGKSNYPLVLRKFGGSAVFVIASSEREDAVATAFDEQVKVAIDQFSGRRPALIALQLIDITREAFAELLKTPNVLHRIARRAFERFEYLDSVAFTSLPTQWITSDEKPTQGQWPMMTLYNSVQKFPAPEVREIF